MNINSLINPSVEDAITAINIIYEQLCIIRNYKNASNRINKEPKELNSVASSSMDNKITETLLLRWTNYNTPLWQGKKFEMEQYLKNSFFVSLFSFDLTCFCLFKRHSHIFTRQYFCGKCPVTDLCSSDISYEPHSCLLLTRFVELIISFFPPGRERRSFGRK